VQRGSRPLLLLVVALLLVPTCLAQSKPQHVRDYIYSQDGRLILTAEASAYPPDSPPEFSASPGQCASDGVALQCGAPTDVGPGLASYTVSRVGTFDVSVNWATDYNVEGGHHYTYSVVATDRAGVSSDPSYADVDVPLCINEVYAPGFSRRVKNSIAARLTRFNAPQIHPYFANPPAKFAPLESLQIIPSSTRSYASLRRQATID
jgi:hypothetical protein